MTTALNQLSKLITQTRKQQHLTQRELAEDAHVSLKIVTNVETDIEKHDIGMKKILRILDALNIAIQLKVEKIITPVIQLNDYPQLKLLTWNRANKENIEEATAFSLYEQYWRLVDQGQLSLKEKTLIERLKNEYGQGIMHV